MARRRNSQNPPGQEPITFLHPIRPLGNKSEKSQDRDQDQEQDREQEQEQEREEDGGVSGSINEG